MKGVSEMKKGMTFLFEAKWWAINQPKGLKSGGDLESALKAYESAKGKLEKSDDADREKAAGAARAALDGVDKAVDAVIKEASRAKGNAEMEITVEVLKKFGGKRDVEKNWIDEQVASDDNMFASPDVYRKYLLTQCKRLRSSGEMNFGLVLGKKAEEHRLALHKAKSAKALGNMLVKETGLHQFTFGVATPSEERAGVVVLWLEGRQLPGIAKKGARMLKKFKPLPFTKLVLMVDGQEVADIDDPEDMDTDDFELDAPDGVSASANLDAAALTQELAELIRRIQGIADPALKGDLARMATQANALLRSNSLEEAKERIDQLRIALDQAGAAANGGNGVAQAAGGTTNAALAKSSEIWKRTLDKVQSEIEKLRAAIVTAYQTQAMVGDIEANYRAKVAGVTETLKEVGLSDKLDAVAAAADMDQRVALIGEVRGIIQRCQSYLASTPLLADLDENPFEPIAIRNTVSTSLSMLEKVVH